MKRRLRPGRDESIMNIMIAQAVKETKKLLAIICAEYLYNVISGLLL